MEQSLKRLLRAAPTARRRIRKARFYTWRARVALSSRLRPVPVQGASMLMVDPRRVLVPARVGIAGATGFESSTDDIVVTVGPTGELRVEQGRAQVERARQDGVRQVAVRVGRRDPAWQHFRAEILAWAATHGGHLYQPLPHPDLVDIPSEHSDGRFELIRANLPVTTGKLLDIGSNWGYFCHRFEELGFNCLAVEAHPDAFYFLQRLRSACDRRFEAVNADVLTLRPNDRFDVVLALNIFHHFLKTADEFERLIAFLRHLQTQVLVFEPHRAEERQMDGAFHNLDQEDFVRFVSAHTGLSNWRCLGKVEKDRSIYLLTQS